MGIRRASGLSLILALLLGCGSEGSEDVDAGTVRLDSAAPAEGRVVLGTGRTGFVEIPDSGGTLELIAGPQGGWHIDVTARIWDFTIEGLVLTYEIRRDGEIVSMPRQFVLREALVVREGDHWLRAGDFVPFEIEMPSDIVGDTVTVTVIVESVEGGRAEDSRTVTIVDEE